MLKYMPLYGSILLTLIIAWVVISTIIGNRRKIRQAVAGHYIVSVCCRDTVTPLGWSQDGWIGRCDNCGETQYLGDDFDNPPPGFEARHAETLRNYERELSNSRRPLPAPVESAEHAGPLTANQGRVLGNPSEVTSGACELCGGELEHTADCPRGVIIDLLPSYDQAERESDLVMPPPPNIGGEGQPDYQGPHYKVAHDRFVPYDVLRDPPEGAAVHIVGSVACVGPLEVEGDGDDAGSIRNEEDS